MTVSYRRQEPPASPELIERLQSQIGDTLPDAYRHYLSEQDGGRLADNSEAVKTIFGLGDVPPSASMWKKLTTYSGRVPAWLLPVAQDEYGSLFTLSLRPADKGSVWLWDHEEEADEGEPPTEDNLAYKAPAWDTFLQQLTSLQK